MEKEEIIEESAELPKEVNIGGESNESEDLPIKLPDKKKTEKWLMLFLMIVILIIIISAVVVQNKYNALVLDYNVLMVRCVTLK